MHVPVCSGKVLGWGDIAPQLLLSVRGYIESRSSHLPPEGAAV